MQDLTHRKGRKTIHQQAQQGRNTHEISKASCSTRAGTPQGSADNTSTSAAGTQQTKHQQTQSQQASTKASGTQDTKTHDQQERHEQAKHKQMQARKTLHITQQAHQQTRAAIPRKS